MTKHAILSASAAHRWIACPPSALLEKEFPDSGSEAAAEGTLAHEICELKIKRYLETEPKKKAALSRKINKLKEDELYAPEMDGHTEEYLEYVKDVYLSYKTKPYIATERKVDFSHCVPEGFGTCDCVIISGNTMHIIDFKYGKGVPVNAENNPQLRLYALGALHEFGILWDIKTIKMHIVQPRLCGFTSETVSVQALRDWAEGVSKTAELAIQGQGEFSPTEEACRFCKARHTCKARAEKHIALAAEDFKVPPLLTDAEVGSLLATAKDLKKWVADLEEYALKTCLSGGAIPGFKAVEGRSNRAFSDQDEAFTMLIEAGVEEAMLYERKPLTLAKVEKLVGKKLFEETVADYVIKPPGKPTLVPEDDKREAITLRDSAEEDFKED